MATFDKLLNKTLLHNHNGREITGGDIGSKVPTNSVQFDTTPTALTAAEGLLQWNATDGTLDLGMSGGDITQQIGQELFMKVRNVSAGTIPNGSPVYISGRTGNRPNIYLAKSDVDSTSNVVGLTTQDIAKPADGFVTTLGYVRQIKTDYSGAGNWGTTWVEGDKLYVSKTVAGQLTNVEPTAPHHSDIIGTVAVVGGVGIGSILVNLQIHKTLEELTDVDGTPLATTGQFPVWNQTAGYFDFNENINNFLRLDASNDPITGNLKLVPTANSTTTFQIFKQDGTTNVFNVDTTNARVGIGTVAPQTTLDVSSTNVFDGVTNTAITEHMRCVQVGGTGGLGNFSTGISFSKINSGRRGAAIASVQTSADVDQMGMAIFTHGSSSATDVLQEDIRINHDGKVGLMTTLPTSDLSFGGNSARTIALERHTTADTAGNTLTVKAGGATSGATDKAGGTLNLSAGISTGANRANISFLVPKQGSTGTTDNTPAVIASLFSSSTSNNIFVFGSTTISTTGLPSGSNNYFAFGGDVLSTIVAYRHTTANTAGNILTIQAGGATSAATDKAGGTLTLKGGISTGTGTSQIILQTATPAASTGTADNAFATRITVDNTGANIDAGLIVNESGSATGDFRVESDTEANMLFLDANGSTDGELWFGGTTNGIKILKGGEMTFEGTATVWDDVVVNLSNIKAPASDPPTWRTYKGCELPAFGAGGTNALYFTCQLPHGYKEGSSIGFHFHCAYPNANAGNSRWTFTYAWTNVGGDFPATATSETLTFAAPAVTDRHELHAFTDIVGTGKTISSVLLCSISRIGGDAADTYASDIYAISADFHVEKNSVGSKTATAK